jgi:nitroimidazol reductase NimA-like FMN-containing flavoprotein (pyridoxamine 5'-phosphate oxidase superfamily)
MTAEGRGGVAEVDGDRVLVPLDRAVAVALLEATEVGRLVFTVRALPEVFPVNFRVFEGSVVVRVSGASRAGVGALDTVVAFEVDEIDAASRTGWSVTVVGHTSEILDRAERERVLALLVPWAGGVRDRLIRIPLDRVTGRRLAVAEPGGMERITPPLR